MTKDRDTKSLLLQTALHLIWAESYGSVSVDDICSKAGAKKGSFYHFFHSKAELAKEALEFLWDEMKPQLDEIFSSQAPPLERIKRYLEAMLREQKKFYKELGYVVGCPFTSVGSEQCSCGDGVTEKSRDILSRFGKYLRHAIQDGIEDGSIPKVDPTKVSNQMLVYELGAMSFARVSNNLAPLEGIEEAYMRLLGLEAG